MMTDKEKIHFADAIITLLSQYSQESKIAALQPIGRLTSRQGIKGFKVAEPGDIVFKKSDRYVLVLESLDGKTSVEIPYNIEILKPHIKFDI